MNFYYQIKGKGADNNWQWPPLESGLVDAINSKQARKDIEEIFGMKMPGGRLKVDADKQQILLTIIDATDKPYLISRFDTKNCVVCGTPYTLNEKYLLRAGGSSEYCSSDCAEKVRKEQAISYGLGSDFNGIHDAVIYKITNNVTEQCYIGKTTQAFTLRWYQHFYQSSHGTKFYEARKVHPVTDWRFEVIEVIDIPKNTSRDDRRKIILDRETFWMKNYNSVEDGYNSLLSVADDLPDDTDENQLSLFENQP